jgi:adenine-specific DNA-methyltransferase
VNPVADTTALEREIDQQVYALYGLTPEEIAIVEGAAP